MARGYISNYVPSPGPSSLSHYDGRFDDPREWQQLYRISEQAGRLRAKADYHENRVERLQDLIEKDAERAEARAETKDVASHTPDSESFWSKIGDGALNALTWTVDNLSRVGYGVQNSLNEAMDIGVQENKEAGYFKQGPGARIKGDPSGLDQIKAFGRYIPNSGDELGRIFESFGEGFSLDKKRVYAQNLKRADLSVNGKQDIPDWLLGTAGFAGDVITDPTTYIGLGMVKKAVGGASGIAKGGGAAVGKGLARIGPGGDGAKVLKGAEQEQLLNHLAGIGKIEVGDTVIEMDKEIAAAALGIHIGQGGRAATKAAKASQIRTSLTLIEGIKRRIAEMPEEMAAKHSAVTALEKQAARLEQGLKGDDELKQFLKDDYQAALDDMAKAGEYPDLPTNPYKTVTEEVDEVVTKGRLNKLARSVINVRIAKNKLAKNPKNARAAQELRKAQQDVSDAAGRWVHSDELSEAFQENAFKDAGKAVREKNLSVSFQRERVLLRQQQEATAALNAAKKSGNAASIRNAEIQLDRVNKSMFHFNEQLADLTSDAYGMSLARELTRTRLLKNPEYKKLNDRVEALQQQVEKTAPFTDEKNAGRLEALERDLTDAISARDNFAASSGEQVSFKDVGESDLFKDADGNPTNVQEVTEALASDYEKQMLETARRSKRTGGENTELFKASGSVGDGQPRIKIGDTEVDYADFARTAKDKNLITKQDHAKAHQQNQGLKEKHTYRTDDKRRNEVQANRDRGITKANPNEKRGQRTTSQDMGVRVTPEAVAFGRIFKEQHGMTVKQFRQRWKDEVGRVEAKKVFVGKGKNKHSFSQEGYVAKREENPVGTKQNGDTIILKGKKITRYQFVRKHKIGSEAEFDSHWRQFAQDKPEEFRIQMRDQFRKLYERQNPGKTSLAQPANAAMRTLTKREEAAIKKQAQAKAEAEVQRRLNDGESIVTKKGKYNPIRIKGTATTKVEDPDTILAAQAREDAQRKAMDIANAKFQARKSERAELLREINDIYARRNATRIKLRKELAEHQKLIEERIDEQSIINLMENTADPTKSYLRISVAGAKIVDVPTPQMLTSAVEKFSGIPLARKTAQIWAKGFHGGSHLEPELNLARLRMQSNTPAIIQHHVQKLKADFTPFKKSERMDAVRMFMKGSKASSRGELDDKTAAFFDDFMAYYDGRIRIGGEQLDYRDINRWLPERFKVQPLRHETHPAIKDGQDLLAHIPNFRPHEHDPLELMWRLTIAGEQAQAAKNMQHTIAETFGVRITDDNEDLAQRLIDDHGWEKSQDVPGNVIFEPEVKDQIARLHQLLGSQKNVDDMLRLYDKTLNLWKASVTVYNPGFYARNGIGEVIMGALDGLTDPRFYGMSGRILKYAKPDKGTKEIEDVLNSMEPWKKYQTLAQKGGQPIKLGRLNITTEEAWVLYADNGLRSGFVSSEFDFHVPTGGSFRSTSAGQFMRRQNEAIRHKAESFEDYFRMAHFLYRMKKSGYTDPVKAAAEAASYVRKYHFDYSDFTNFEKSAMVRLFPFYKWTRKSLPLMVGMLFTRPGKAMLYPKAMQNLSYATGGTDPMQDDNGFNPNYEDEVVPDWMRRTYAYPLFKSDSGDQTYFNVATPQFDAYKFAADPVGNAANMLTPALKIPLELNQGETLGSKFPTDDKSEYAMRQNPWTSLAATLTDKVNSGEDTPKSLMMDPRTLSFISGLGFLENTKSRQQGEVFRLMEEANNNKQADKIKSLFSWIESQKPNRQ